MIELLITLAVLTGLFWIGYHVTGTLLSAAIWLFIKLPFALILGWDWVCPEFCVNSAKWCQIEQNNIKAGAAQAAAALSTK